MLPSIIDVTYDEEKKISRKVTVDIYYDAKTIKIKLIMHEQRVNKSQSWKSAKVHREKKNMKEITALLDYRSSWNGHGYGRIKKN